MTKPSFPLRPNNYELEAVKRLDRGVKSDARKKESTDPNSNDDENGKAEPNLEETQTGT